MSFYLCSNSPKNKGVFTNYNKGTYTYNHSTSSVATFCKNFSKWVIDEKKSATFTFNCPYLFIYESDNNELFKEKKDHDLTFSVEEKDSEIFVVGNQSIARYSHDKTPKFVCVTHLYSVIDDVELAYDISGILKIIYKNDNKDNIVIFIGLDDSKYMYIKNNIGIQETIEEKRIFKKKTTNGLKAVRELTSNFYQLNFTEIPNLASKENQAR